MQFFHRIIERIRSWAAARRSGRRTIPLLLDFASHTAPLHREVTPHGVRVFSLCNSCGARLNASATLCEECAQKPSRPTRPI